VAAEQVKLQGQLEMKKLELASKERIEAAKIRAGLTETSAELDSKESIASMETATKRAGQMADQAHTERMTHLKAHKTTTRPVERRNATTTPPCATPHWHRPTHL